MQNYTSWTMCMFPSIENYWKKTSVFSWFLALELFRPFFTLPTWSSMWSLAHPQAGFLRQISVFLQVPVYLMRRGAFGGVCWFFFSWENIILGIMPRQGGWFAFWCLPVWRAGKVSQVCPLRGFLEVRWGSGEDTVIKTFWVPRMCIICQVIFLSFQLHN